MLARENFIADLNDQFVALVVEPLVGRYRDFAQGIFFYPDGGLTHGVSLPAFPTTERLLRCLGLAG
jgi:hypothetical protein